MSKMRQRNRMRTRQIRCWGPVFQTFTNYTSLTPHWLPQDILDRLTPGELYRYDATMDTRTGKVIARVYRGIAR